jgi:glycerophosphoryl diester phosphodiesterase
MRSPTIVRTVPALLCGLLLACPTPEPEPEPEPQLPVVDRAACMVDPDCDYLFSVAHRGASMQAPENTLLSHQIARDLGADAVEVDIRVTSDDVLVLMHDGTVDRTTNGSGHVDQMTLAQIRELVAESNIDGVPDQPIPTFAEALEALGPTMLVNVDTKSNRWDLMHADITAAGMLDRVWVQTGGADEVQMVREQYPDLIQMADAGDIPTAEAALPWAPEMMEIPLIVTGNELFDYCLANNMKPAQNALGLSDAGALIEIEEGGDGSRAYGVLVGRGARIIQTDFPDLLVPILDELNAERGWRRPE